MNEYDAYYTRQSGGAGINPSAEGLIGPVYRAGFIKGQRGSGGLSNFFRGVWSFVSPLFQSGAARLGTEALRTGANILADASAQPATLKEVATKHLVEGRDNLVNKMKGSGRKVRRPRKKRVMMVRRKKTRQTTRKRKASRTKADIFFDTKRQKRK